MYIVGGVLVCVNWLSESGFCNGIFVGILNNLSQNTSILLIASERKLIAQDRVSILLRLNQRKSLILSKQRKSKRILLFISREQISVHHRFRWPWSCRCWRTTTTASVTMCLNGCVVGSGFIKPISFMPVYWTHG